MKFAFYSFSIAILLLSSVMCSFNNKKRSLITQKDSLVSIDSTFYTTNRLYELIEMKGNKRNGTYLSYTEGHDTLISGMYVNGLREGKWLLKHINSKVSEPTNPLSQFAYENRYTLDPFRIYFEFKNDSIKHMLKIQWYNDNPNQIMSQSEVVYGIDTMTTFKGWHSNGIHSQISKTINGELAHDTTLSWREDGTLYEMSVYKRGKLIVSRDYDKTGTKVIKEKTGQ